MASASIAPSSITIPNGGSVNVTVSWTLDPGTPDQPGHLTLTMDGSVIFDSAIVKQGTPAETEPQIVLANPTTGQALLASDVATVKATADPHVFTLS